MEALTGPTKRYATCCYPSRHSYGIWLSDVPRGLWCRICEGGLSDGWWMIITTRFLIHSINFHHVSTVARNFNVKRHRQHFVRRTKSCYYH